MVPSAKMLLNTGTPSMGHPVIFEPLKGWHSGEENGLVPTSEIPLGPTNVPAGTQFPPAPALYGSTKPVQVSGATLNGWVTATFARGGITVPGAMKYWLSDPKGPQFVCAPPGALNK